MGTVNEANEMPAFGTHDHEMWMKGAKAEAAAREAGVRPESRELAEFFDAMTTNGYGPQTMVEMTAVVYGPGLPWRKRLSIAWKMIRGYRRRRWYGELVREKRDLWVGVYWDRDDTGLHLWITLVPTLVIHLRKAA